MSADSLQHVVKGEALLPRMSADAWNAFCDAAKHDRERKNNIGSKPLSRHLTPSVIAWCQNDSGDDLGKFAVVKLTGVAVATAPTLHEFNFRDNPLFTVDEPGAATDLFGILYEPIPEDGIGRVIVGGISLVDVKINDVGHEWAKPIAADSTKLESATSGAARILWKETGGATRRCVVILWDGGPTAAAAVALTFVGSAGGAITSPSSDSTPTASGQTITLTAGTWIVFANYDAVGLGNAGNAGGYLEGWVHDNTNALDVPASHRIFAQAAAESGGTVAYGNFSFTGIYIVSGATALEVYAQRINNSPGSFSACTIGVSGFVFEAVKIG